MSQFRILSKSRLGFRGGFLLTLSLLCGLYGTSIAFPDPATMVRADTLWRNLYAPPLAWGISWWIVCVVCLVTAFIRQDRTGYGLGVGWLIFWMLQCVSSQIWGGYSRGYVTAGIFGAALVWTALASGVRESRHIDQPPPEPYDQDDQP